MNRFNVLITAYALLLLIGGIIGYFVAGSSTSLVTSASFATLLIAALFLIPVFPNFAYRTIYTLSFALVLFFSYRWYYGKFFPSGLLSIVSVVCLVSAYVFNRNR